MSLLGPRKMDTSMRLQLTILPQTLVVAQLTRVKLQTAAALPLLRVLLLDERRENRFVSITDTGSDISLILDEDSAAVFPTDDILNLSGVKYKAFQISGEGALGFSLTGIIQSISEPLAKANISIFYLSTFETDFVFVPTQHVLLAVSVLQQKFHVHVEGYEEESLPPQEPPKPSHVIDPRRHPLVVGSGELYLAALPKDMVDAVGTVLMRLIFTPPENRVFFSYTETVTAVSDEISIILDQESMNLFPSDILNVNADSWKLIKVGEGPLGFEEAGIVSGISSTLSQARISLFYISTFQTDYCLIQTADNALALASLKQAGYVVKQ